MTRVVLHIDRLVLRGVARGDAAAVSAALEARLHALVVADRGAALLERSGPRGTHRMPTTVPAGTGAAALGHAVADRIAGGSAPAPSPTEGGPR